MNDLLNTNVLTKPETLKGFKSFFNKYYPGNVKREEISLITQNDSVYFLKIEYFTTVIPYSKDLKFNSNFNKSQFAGVSSLDEVNKIDESQNITEDENTILIDNRDRPLIEREFFKKILISLSSGKKVVVQNKYAMEGVHSTLVRYVVLNSIFVYNV